MIIYRKTSLLVSLFIAVSILILVIPSQAGANSGNAPGLFVKPTTLTPNASGYFLYKETNAQKKSSQSSKKTQTLQPGSSGATTNKLQSQLKEGGYLSGDINGSYDSATTEAVKAFQRDRGLTVDGIAGANTIATLNGLTTGSAVATGTGVATGSGVQSSACIPTGSSIATGSAITSGSGITTGTGIASGSTVATGMAIPTGQTLRPGSTNTTVDTLQKRLKDKGYILTENMSGTYDSSTTAAVIEFQKDNNLVADGIAGFQTITELNSDTKSDLKSDLLTSQTLQPGVKGSVVSKLQSRLKEEGFYKGEISGDYDVSTTEAVRKFQLDKKIFADGIASNDTITKLNEITVSSGADSIPITNDTVPHGACVQTSQTLRPGVKGSVISTLQSRLKEEGFYKGEISGDYDVSTTEAVTVFQRTRGLGADGIAGTNTIKELNEKVTKDVKIDRP